LLLLGQARQLLAGSGRLFSPGTDLVHQVIDLVDVAVDVLRDCTLLFGGRCDLHVAITDPRHPFGDLLQQLTRSFHLARTVLRLAQGFFTATHRSTPAMPIHAPGPSLY
jgi:hypothetical protein